MMQLFDNLCVYFTEKYYLVYYITARVVGKFPYLLISSYSEFTQFRFLRPVFWICGLF